MQKRGNTKAMVTSNIDTPIKKRDESPYKNYVGIALVKLVYNFLAILITKLHVKIGDYQAEFSKGNSVNHQIFTLEQIMSNNYEQNLAMRNLFIYFQQAYDRIKSYYLKKMVIDNTESKVYVNGLKSPLWKKKQDRQSTIDKTI